MLKESAVDPSHAIEPDQHAGRLRVLAVGTLFPNDVQPTRGIFNALALEHLAGQAEVKVIAPIRWFPGLGWLSSSQRRLAHIAGQTQYRGLPVTHPRFFATPRFGRRWHGWFYAQSVRQHLLQAAGEFQPEVLLAMFAFPDGVAVQQLGEELGVPVVIKCLGSDVHQLLSEQVRGAMVLDALRRCARVITVSEHLRNMIVEHRVNADKIDVVYNGTDRQLFRPMPRTEARRALKLQPYGKIVLCVANLLPIKRHVDLLRAFAVLLREHLIEAKLALVGEGPMENELRQLADQLCIADAVHFVGNCPHAQIPLWINSSDAVTLASANEGLPNAINEALACGRPVVATRVGGIPEVIVSDDYGRLVPPGNPAALAQALCDVLGRAWNPKFLSACPQVISWHEATMRLFDVLQRACGHNIHIGQQA